jgi:2-iminoacetate synthase ThiH
VSRRDDNSVLLSDIEDSLRRVLNQAQIKAAPLTDEEIKDHLRQLQEQGVRELSLKLAAHSHTSALEYSGGFSDDDVLETARKFAEFIHHDAPDGGDE